MKPRDLHGQYDRDPSMGGATNLAVTLVAATSRIIVNPRTNRRRLLIINDGVVEVYLAKADTAQLNSGIRLNPSGGWYEEVADTLGYVYVGPFAAISTGTPAVLICEEF